MKCVFYFQHEFMCYNHTGLIMFHLIIYYNIINKHVQLLITLVHSINIIFIFDPIIKNTFSFFLSTTYHLEHLRAVP